MVSASGENQAVSVLGQRYQVCSSTTCLEPFCRNYTPYFPLPCLSPDLSFDLSVLVDWYRSSVLKSSSSGSTGRRFSPQPVSAGRDMSKPRKLDAHPEPRQTSVLDHPSWETSRAPRHDAAFMLTVARAYRRSAALVNFMPSIDLRPRRFVFGDAMQPWGRRLCLVGSVRGIVVVCCGGLASSVATRVVNFKAVWCPYPVTTISLTLPAS